MNSYSRSKKMFRFPTFMISLDAIPHHRDTQIMKAYWQCKSFYYTILWLKGSLKLVSAIFDFFTK